MDQLHDKLIRLLAAPILTWTQHVFNTPHLAANIAPPGMEHGHIKNSEW